MRDEPARAVAGTGTLCPTPPRWWVPGVWPLGPGAAHALRLNRSLRGRCCVGCPPASWVCLYPGRCLVVFGGLEGAGGVAGSLRPAPGWTRRGGASTLPPEPASRARSVCTSFSRGSAVSNGPRPAAEGRGQGGGGCALLRTRGCCESLVPT